MADLILPPGVGDATPTATTDIPVPAGVGPSSTEQTKRPSLGERAWAHAQDKFEDTIAGAIGAVRDAGGGDIDIQIRNLQNQIKTYEARPGFLGGPDKQRIASLQAKIQELSGQKQSIVANRQAARGARQTAYEQMPPAEGFLENTAAVVGSVAGSLASPETLLGPWGKLGQAKAVVQSVAPVAEKALAIGKEAVKGGLQMAGIEAAGNTAAQTIKIKGDVQDKFDLGELATHAGTGLVGGTILTGIFGQFAKPMIARALSPAEEAVKANRGDRIKVYEQSLKAGDESVGYLTRVGQEIQQGLFNWWSPVIRVQKEAGLGKTVLDKSVDRLHSETKLYPADEFQLLRGTSSQIQAALEDGMFRINEHGNAYVKTSDDSLIKILKDLGPDANSFLEYVAALRAAYAKEIRNIDTGFDPQRTADIIRGFAPRMNAVGEDAALRDKMNLAIPRYKEWTDWILDYKVDSGLYSPVEKAAILQENPIFIPFYHLDTTTGEAKMLSSMGKDKYLEGSDEVTNDLAQNLVTYLSRSLESANKNRAKQALFDMIDTMPGGEKWATKKSDVFRMTADDIRAALLRDPTVSTATKNAVPQMSMSDLRSVYFRKALKGNEEVVFRNGDAHIYTVHDKALFKTLQQLTPQQLWVTKLNLGHITKRMNYYMRKQGIPGFLPEGGLPELKGMFTSLVTHNPAFAAYTNLVRDSQEAFVTGKHTNIPVYAQIKSMIEIAGKDPKLKEFYMNGGGYASLGTVERNTNINKMYAQVGIDFKRDVLNDENMIKATKDKFMNVMEQAEQASRLSEYKGLDAKGVPSRISALAGREVSTDFGGYGAWQLVQEFNAITPFLSASLNAMRRQGRTMDAKRAAWTVAKGTAITVAAVSAYAYNKKWWEKEYDAQPDWLKESNILIGMPKFNKETGATEFSHFVALPLSYGVGYSFGSIPLSFVKAAETGDYNKIAKTMNIYFKNMFNVAETPPVFATAEAMGGAAGIFKEEDIHSFTGAPTVPHKLQGVDKRAQHTPQTSSYMVELGEKTGLSPILVENAINSLFLYISEGALAMAERFTGKREELGRGTLPDPNKQDMPYIGRVIKDRAPTYGPMDEEFYRLTKLVSKETNTLNLANTRLDFMRTYKELEKIDPKYGQMKDLNPTITEVQNNIATIDNTIALTWMRKDMDGKTKREELNKLGWQRSFMMSSAIEQLVQNPEIREKLRPQGVMPFLKTLWTGSPTGYAEGGLVEGESWDGTEEDFGPENPDWAPPSYLPGRELKAGPSEDFGTQALAAMNAGLAGRSYPDVGPRSFLLPMQYNEFTGQYEWAVPGVMDAFPLGGGPIPMAGPGSAVAPALVGIKRFPRLFHGTKNPEAVDLEGFRRGKSAERNKPGTSTSADPHVSTLLFSDSPEGLFEVHVPYGEGYTKQINPHTQVRNMDPFSYAIAAEAEEIPGILAEKKPFHPFREDEIFFKGNKYSIGPKAQEETGQSLLYPERTSETMEIAKAARKRAVKLDNFQDEIERGIKNFDDRYVIESIQKAWRLAKGYPRLEDRVFNETLAYINSEHFDMIAGNVKPHPQIQNISVALDTYKMQKASYDEFIKKQIRPHKRELKEAVDKNKWNLSSKEDLYANIQVKHPEFGYTTKRISVNALATETNDRYRAMMRAKDKLVDAIEKADPGKIKRKLIGEEKVNNKYGTAPKGWKEVEGADFFEMDTTKYVKKDANYSLLKQLHPPLEDSESQVNFIKAQNSALNGYKTDASDYLANAMHVYISNAQVPEEIKSNLQKARAYINKGFTPHQKSILLNNTNNVAQLLSLNKSELSAILKNKKEKVKNKSDNIDEGFNYADYPDPGTSSINYSNFPDPGKKKKGWLK